MKLTRTNEEIAADYDRFRGKCKKMSEALVTERPELRLVRGHYFCPIWGRNEEHWWCEDAEGTVVDPTRLQFPSAGFGHYEEFDGNVQCEQCNKSIREEDAVMAGRYATCSTRCAMYLTGVGEFYRE